MLIRSKCVFVLMAHFDKSVQAEWHLARPTMEKSHGWCWRDNYKSGIWIGEIKKNHDKQSGSICNGGFKGFVVHSINLPFQR